MSKKIVVITGSPRKNGNSFAMTEAFVKAAEAIERTAALLKWHMIGSVLVPGVYKCGDIDSTDGCAQAAALAERL